MACNTDIEATKSKPRKRRKWSYVSNRGWRSLSQQKSPQSIDSKNNMTALQRFPQFLKVGTVYKWGLRVGVKICLKCMTVLPLKENSVLLAYFFALVLMKVQ